MYWFVIGVILICITLYLFKSVKVAKSEYYSSRYDYGCRISYQDFKIEYWHTICIIGMGLIPILNIIAFIGFIILYISCLYRGLEDDEVYVKYCKLSDTRFKLKKIVTSIKHLHI